MARTATDLKPELHLSPDQQDLLLAALSSNKPTSLPNSQIPRSAGFLPNGASRQNSDDPTTTVRPSSMSFSPETYQTPQLHHMELNGSPLLNDIDYNDINFELDGSFDYDLGVDGFEGSPESNDQEHDLHEKRKSPEDEGEEHGGKRQENEDKTAKKPGRKPLTSEPTTKRKAQNRAAQRAFRERKEKHLKDLEQKVIDLENASESANHENGLLRAQVERLQAELKEYRKRLHTNGLTSFGLPGSQANLWNTKLGTNGINGNAFQFDFPRFGGLPLTQTFGKPSVSSQSPKQNGEAYKIPLPGVLERVSSTKDASASPKPSDPKRSNSNGDIVSKANTPSVPQQRLSLPNTNLDDISALFSPSVLKSASNGSDYMSHKDGSTGTTSTMNTPQLNGGTSHDFSASPSASSVSQHGPGSSCATSPEPSHNSPGNSKPSENGLNKIDEEGTGKAEETYVCVPGKDGEASFCKKLNMACGNPHNPVPRAMSQSSASQTPAANSNGIEWLSQQNGGQFDPVLFGDYRDPADQSTPGFGTFFDDALTGLPTDFDFGSPAPVNTEPHKKTLVEVLDEKDDEDEVVPADDDKSLLSCNKIWDKIQNDPRFQAGEIDVDNLCTELRQKAKCSETGVVVNEKDVNAVLLKVRERNAALSGSR